MQVHIVGVPLDLGAGRPGADGGPAAIRAAGLHAALRRARAHVIDRGDVSVPPRAGREATDGGHLRHAAQIAAVCAKLAAEVAQVIGAGGFPLVLGGDHSIAMGTLAGLRRAGFNAGVIWLDAHGDFNTAETSPSGNVHGMALAVATGRGPVEFCNLAGRMPAVAEDAAVLVGVRSLDAMEADALGTSGVTVWTMSQVRALGVAAVVRRAVAAASGAGARPLHLSCDLDALDPAVAPGVGTPVPGGLTYAEALEAVEVIRASGLLHSMDIVEVNPALDPAGRTARAAVALVAGAVGGPGRRDAGTR